MTTFLRFSRNRGRSDGLFPGIMCHLDIDFEDVLESLILQWTQPLSAWIPND